MTDDGFERIAIVVMASGVGVVFAAVTLEYVAHLSREEIRAAAFLAAVVTLC